MIGPAVEGCSGAVSDAAAIRNPGIAAVHISSRMVRKIQVKIVAAGIVMCHYNKIAASERTKSVNLAGFLPILYFKV